MKILVTILKPSIDNQILDAWHAYRQHLSGQAGNYSNPAEYTFLDKHQPFNKEEYNLTMLFDYSNGLKTTPDLVDHYDLVFIGNGTESLTVSSPRVKQLANYNNVYLIANSYLSKDHSMKDKVVWFSSNFMGTREFWIKHFYPHCYDIARLRKNKRTNFLYYINGANRAERQLAIDCIKQQNVDIEIKSSLSTGISEIGEVQWESPEDTEFRLWVNRQYTVELLENFQNSYYSSGVPIGIDQKFGQMYPGFFILPLYFENYCVIFPESNWQNNELSATEKAFKCFYAGSLPWPIAGANVNRLYNELGFHTAWNLLPPELQEFDSDLDHRSRYHKVGVAIKWLSENTEVFLTDRYKQMTQENQLTFLASDTSYQMIKRFDELVSTFIRI